MESKFRTSKKDDADLFFVPAYVKCVRMLGGLNDKEINQTYVKVKPSRDSLIQLWMCLCLTLTCSVIH